MTSFASETAAKAQNTAVFETGKATAAPDDTKVRRAEVKDYNDQLIETIFENTVETDLTGSFAVGSITQLIQKPTSMGSDDGPYFPAVLNMARIFSGRASNQTYLVLASKDHGPTDEGGIWGWDVTSLESTSGITELTNPIIDADALGGSANQLETPDLKVIHGRDGTFSHISLLAHANTYGTNQSTAEWTSTDGSTWTINSTFNPVIDVDLNRYGIVGDGHTGYPRRLIDGYNEYAVHLAGGTSLSYRGLSMRRAGSTEKFTLLSQKPIGGMSDRMYDYWGSTVTAGGRFGSEQPFYLRGQLYVVATVAQGTSAGGVPVGKDIVIAKAAIEKGDLKIKGHLQTLVTPTASTWYAYQVNSPTVVDVDHDKGEFMLVFTGYRNTDKDDYSIGTCKVTLC